MKHSDEIIFSMFFPKSSGILDRMSTLHLLATPIGNMEDISLRVLRLLRETQVLACEDTRVTRKILDRYEINPPATMLSYHEHNEERVGKRLLEFLNSGMDIALCSDGGMPAISDPGYRIIVDALQQGHTIDVAPGPCAVETALLASGMPTSSYTFRGFPPRKSGKKQNWFAEDAEAAHTMVVYESPHRVAATLQDAYEVLGNRLAAVCLELTKKFESVTRGYLQELSEQFKDKQLKGEAVIVIAGNNPKFIAEQQ